ncbi:MULTISPECIES: SIR2 family protein [Rhizobium/Agrobacterium group]|uniref:SIR2 family protein n=1 Tax=Agrobacterium vitis TaxID=373 RepID=A0A7K1RKH4_AGRVI|nr:MULTISPECIES: SIR2 family protein [Rhizobium/Agrobacterium group]MVA58522.1 SIR2 family protein [Agrobacterium vitis]
MNLENIAKIAQTCFQNNPTIVLGSGSSMPHGLPSMGDLSKYLMSNIETNGEAEADAWLLVKTALTAGDHLEAALEGKNLPAGLLSQIVSLTWKCVNEKDLELYCNLTSDPAAYPLGTLIAGLFKSSNAIVNVVTTNYDRVVEFACNSAGLLFQTGFAPGYLQKWESTGGVSFQRGGKEARVVKIWKVHGSLDWFRTSDDRTIGLPVFTLPQNGIVPLIVTPGLNKYEKTYEDPFRTTINGADDALKRASAFLSVGFGFRDQHIHPKIIERCREKNVPIVVLARTLTEEAKSFLKEKAGTNYLGIERHDGGSRVYGPSCPGGEIVGEHDLWALHGFNKLVT